MSIGFTVVVMGNGHKVAACLYAQLWLLGEPEPWGKHCSWIVRVECARTNTQGLCPIPSSFLTPVSWTHPSSCNTTLWSTLSPIAWATLRKETGGGTPPPGDRSPRGFSKLFQPRGSTSFGCSRRSFTAGGSSWIWRLWAWAEGSRLTWTMGQAHPPQLHQPRDSPSLGNKLPRLQGCDSSPGHQGLRGIESASFAV